MNVAVSYQAALLVGIVIAGGVLSLVLHNSDAAMLLFGLAGGLVPNFSVLKAKQKL